MESVYRISAQLVEKTSLDIIRYIFDEIQWEDRLIGIKGARGVGKTTIMLQYIKSKIADRRKALYVSLDNIWFSAHTLFELAEYHAAHGGKYLFLDEVHRYPNWSVEIKNIYDSFPDMHIVFTGSSLLEIDNSISDLSRRCVIYEMRGLSFREFLNFEGEKFGEVHSLQDIMKSHYDIATQISARCKILPKFEKYLKRGYYPYYRGCSEITYLTRVQQVVNTIIDYDIPAVTEIEYASLKKAKQLVVILSETVPYTLNIQSLCTMMQIGRNQLMRLFDLLDRAGVIRMLYAEDRGLKQIVKPEKIVFGNTNIMDALSSKAETGTIRETFFANQLSASNRIIMPQKGDFLVNSAYLFGVGGHGKGYRQISGAKDSFVVADGIEIGIDNKIPLWLFGMMY